MISLIGPTLLLLTAHTLALDKASVSHDPFHGSLYNVSKVQVTPYGNDSPLQSTVYYPSTNGSFTPVYFIGGLAGVQTAETYSDLLSRVASQGYVVMGMDRLPLLGNLHGLKDLWSDVESVKLGNGVDTFVSQMKWLHNYVTNEINPATNWSRTVIMCHSEGCDVTLNMLLNFTNIAQAVVYIDPFSITSKMITAAVPARIPSFSYVSALSEIFPACCIKGFGYRRFYDLMNCTKVKKFKVSVIVTCWIIVTGNIKVCQTTNDTRLDEYKNCLQGTIVSFLRWTLDDDVTMKKYVTDSKYISLPLLDLAYDDTKC